MKTDEDGVADLTPEAGLEEPDDSELFAHLASRAPTASGLHRRPRKNLAEVARLGALVPSVAPGRSVPPSLPGSGVRTSLAPAPAHPRLSSTGPPAVPVGSAAFDDDDALTPALQTIPVPARGFSRRTRLLMAAAGALSLLGLAAFAARAFKPSGSLLVTVTGPGSSEVSGIEVLLDGERRCIASPCRISSIVPGTHLVSVRAKGFHPTAALATTVSGGAESVMNVALSPAAVPPPLQPTLAQPTKPAPPAKTATARTSATEAAEKRLPAIARATAPAAAPAAGNKQIESRPAPTASATGDQAAFGTLRIVSLPVASILLDGRPIGRTPQVVRVSAGQHRVAIVAGEDRRAQTVSVAPGATRVVSVRF